MIWGDLNLIPIFLSISYILITIINLLVENSALIKGNYIINQHWTFGPECCCQESQLKKFKQRYPTHFSTHTAYSSGHALGREKAIFFKTPTYVPTHMASYSRKLQSPASQWEPQISHNAEHTSLCSHLYNIMLLLCGIRSVFNIYPLLPKLFFKLKYD